MLRFVPVTAFLAVCIFSTSASAGTIIKLGLGGDPTPDIEFDGTILSTMDDGNGGSSGDQNTDITYLDFLSSFPDVPTSTASFSLNGLTTAGPASVFGGVLMIQNFTGGTFDLYDPANSLLLSGSMTTSALTGPIGPPATGALFTTSISSVTGGSLAPLIATGSLSLSMSLTNINNGAGFSVGATAPLLTPFTADATLSIAADPIPEPTTLAMWFAGAGFMAARVRRIRRLHG
jgi:hypothetical protein